MWLAETSQQPISQTTWLKVHPQCSHCNHCLVILFNAAMLQTALCLYFYSKGFLYVLQVLYYNNNHDFNLSYTRSLAVARFD